MLELGRGALVWQATLAARIAAAAQPLTRSVNVFVTKLATAPFVNVKIRGLEKFRTGETYCIVANHASALDAFIMGLLGERDFRGIIKRSLLFYPILGEPAAGRASAKGRRGREHAASGVARPPRSRLGSGSSPLNPLCASGLRLLRTHLRCCRRLLLPLPRAAAPPSCPAHRPSIPQASSSTLAVSSPWTARALSPAPAPA